MPYETVTDLPDSVTNVLPMHAQVIYKEAFNSAYDEYDTSAKRRGDEDRETVAHKVAWSAVKKAGYTKGEDEKWHKEQ
jgi:cation transport regulator